MAPCINMKDFFRVSFLFFSCLLATVPGVSAQNQGDRLSNLKTVMPAIDSICREYVAQHHLPSLVVGLVADGKLIHTFNAGELDLGKKNAANSQSVYRIASMTKSVAALAILQLRDAGKLKLDDPVSQYIPEIKGQRLTTDAPEITIRHLLTHAAGFPEDNPWGDRQLAISDKTMLAMFKKGISFSNVPGIAYEYSNMGFAMLGYIITKVSGQPYQTYTQQKIFTPLGMTSTYWDYAKVPAGQLAHGYRWLNGQWVEQPMLGDGAYGAMGGLLTSIDDFSKYVGLHLSAWPARNDQESPVIKRSSLREMHQGVNISTFNPNAARANGQPCPQVAAYGYGLRWAKDCDQKVSVGHSGGLPGFGSNWNMLPDYGIGIVSFSNLTYAPASSLNRLLIDKLVAAAKLPPKPLPVSSILNQRKNELVGLLPDWNNAAAQAIFAENFFLDYFPDQLRQEATAIFAKAGKIVKVGELIPENNLRGYFVLVGEKADIEVSFTLSPENPPLIQEYNIRELPKTK